MSDVTTGSVFNPQFFMSPPWWIGRVEEKETWSDNIAGETFTNISDIKGWSHRYKVRIFNWHTGELDKLPPKDMAFCQVVMPVTAGSGHGGASITPSIESGSIVFGFFMDGMAGQEGYIIGTIGNSNNNVPRTRGGTAPNQTVNTPTGLSAPPVPATGPGSLSNNLQDIPDETIRQLSTSQLNKLLDPSQTAPLEVSREVSKAIQEARAAKLDEAEVVRLGQVAAVLAKKRLGTSATSGASGNCNLGYQQFGDTYTSGNEDTAAKVPDYLNLWSNPLFLTEAQLMRNYATYLQDGDMRRKIPLLDVCKDGKSDNKGIQLVMQNLLNDIEKLKKQFNQVSAFANEVSQYSALVQEKVLGAIDEISGYLKNTLTGARGYVLDLLNKQVEKIAENLFPTKIPELYVKVEEGTNLINCLFNNLISGLKGLLANLLSNLLDQFINAPLCAVENFLSNFVDSIIGPILSTVEAILAPINALIGGVTSFLGSFSGILDFISGILQFFSCDESPDCIEYNQISQDGPATPTFNLDLGLPDGGVLSGSDSEAIECPTGPAVCGSPLLKVFGNTIDDFIEPQINPIISPISSSVIGFDVINPGSGFLSDPTAVIVDPCGNGVGAALQVNMIDDGTGGTGGTGGTVGSGGTGTGGTGGTGGGGTGIGTTNQCDVPRASFEKNITQELTTTKKIKNLTIISPGTGYLSAPNGSLGGGGRVWKEPDEGYVRTKCGGYYVVQPYKPIPVEPGDTYYPPDGPPRVIEEDEIITLPLVPVTPPKPENLGSTYPVILCIEEIKVLDGGFGYRPGDQLIITPDNGTKVELIINDFGNIVSVKVIEGGCGFLDFPEIKTNSATGYNATFTPIFKSTRLDDFNKENIDNLERGNIPLIHVVDCVGKVI